MTHFSLHIKLFISSLCFISALCSHLTLLPDISQIIMKAGDDLAVTCLGENLDSSKIHWEPFKYIEKNQHRIKTERKNLNSTKVVMLVLTKIEASDAMQFSCTYSSQEKVSFQLIVQEPISFRDTSKVQNETNGALAMTVRCEASGKPDPMIKWSANGKHLIPPKFEPVGDGLIIRNLTPDDAGEYLCMAMQDGVDTFETAAIQVNVLYGPTWTEPETKTDIYLVKKSRALLSCQANAFPQASVSWFFNKNQINDANEFVLNVTELGHYHCEVSNEFGKMTRLFTVSEGFLPGRPVNMKAVNSSKNSLELHFIPPNASKTHNITGYKVELFDKNRKYNHKEVKLRHEPPFLVTNLKPDTTYLIRLRAENGVGLGDYSLQVEAKTSQAFRIFVNIYLVVLLLCVRKLH